MNNPSKKLKQLHESDGIEWFKHPERFDWEQWRKEEKLRWLALDNDRKQLERFEQQMADGHPLTPKQIREYDRLEIFGGNRGLDFLKPDPPK